MSLLYLKSKKEPLTVLCMPLLVMPLASDVLFGKFDLFLALLKSLDRADESLQDGDILVISTKYASNSEGRILDLNNVRVSDAGRDLAARFFLDERVAEVILRESDEVFGGVAGFVIATSAPFGLLPMSGDVMAQHERPYAHAASGPRSASYGLGQYGDCTQAILAPNAGIDASNTKKGRVILYPSAPYVTAELLRRKILLELGVAVAVLLVDSRLMPARAGTCGVSVACAGMYPVTDQRSKPDLDGNPLKVTFQATADNIAAIANHVMGEGSESTPFAIVRGLDSVQVGVDSRKHSSSIPADQCVYVRGLSS